MVEMEYVQSTNVECVGYDAVNAELHVKYLGGQITYVYEGVPQDIHERLMSAPSKGQFMHREVLNVYPFRRQ